MNRAPLLLSALVLLGRVGGIAAAAPAANGEDRGVSLFVEHAPCVRLFHSGGDVGCRSERKEGVAGPLLLVDSEGVLRDIEVCVSVCLCSSRQPSRDNEIEVRTMTTLSVFFTSTLSGQRDRGQNNDNLW